MGPQRAAAISLLGALALAGCGTAEPQPPDAGPGNGRYLPLATGSRWTHLATDPDTDETTEKTQVVEVLEEPPGKPETVAYRMRTEKVDGVTVSWQEDRDVEIVRHLEQNYDIAGNLLIEEAYSPYKLRIDERPEHTSLGATYTQVYTETHTNITLGQTTMVEKQEDWTVEAVDESVTVPAGTFSCIRVRRGGGDPTAPIKTYFFAKGVGKVKEVGGQTEELLSYEIAGGT
jgi:hypothetical protein